MWRSFLVLAGRDRSAHGKCRHPVFLDRSRSSRCLRAPGEECTLRGMEPMVSPLSGTAVALEVKLLGGFAVAVDGIGIPAGRWSSLRAAHLLQLLSLQPRHRLTRDLTIDALWPQLDPKAGA